MKIRKVAATVLAASLSFPAAAGDVVVIKGERIRKAPPRVDLISRDGGGFSHGGGWGDGGGAGSVNVVASNPAATPGVVVAAWLEKKADVRCAPAVGEQTRQTTSHAQPMDRQMAALAVFRSIPLTQRKDAIVGGLLRVTYADGGSEQWSVPSPSFSDGGINLPMPGTLKLGSGNAETTSCVGV